MNASLKALLNEQYKLVAELREENKRLEEENKILKELIRGATEQLKELKEKLNKAGLEEYGFFNEY